MIAPEAERAIQAGLRAGVSQRRIARETGVSRATVGLMANGRRLVDLAQRTAPKPPEAGAAISRENLELLFVIARREPGEPTWPNEPLTIALRDEDEERYLRLRAAKELEFFHGE